MVLKGELSTDNFKLKYRLKKVYRNIVLAIDSVAQLVEQLTLNQWVDSSNLSGVTLKPFYLGRTAFFLHPTHLNLC